MATLHFNSYLDRWKQKFKELHGHRQFTDHLQRAGISYVDWKLTATQMDGLNATPISLLAAPGSGLMNVILGGITFIDAGATPFEVGSATLKFRYTDASGVEAMTAIPNAQIESATDTYYRSIAAAGVPVANAAIVAELGTDCSAGDGTIYGRIWYRTIKIAELGVTQELS